MTEPRSPALSSPEPTLSADTTSMRTRPDGASEPAQAVHISNARRYFLFAIFCVANLLDAYNLNALFTGLPVLKEVFGLDEVDASWVMSAFQLTYAAFLLIVSDIPPPWYCCL